MTITSAKKKTWPKVFILLAALSSPLFAADKPSELNTLIRTDQVHGQTTLTWFFMDVYQISLWTDSKIWSMKKPYALSIVYKMNFSADSLIDKTLEELLRLGAPAKDLKNYKNKLAAVFPSVNVGDRITAYFKPSSGVSFFYNGKPTGVNAGVGGDVEKLRPP